MFRNLSKTSASLCDLKLELPDVDISTFRILQGSALIGKTLAQIELRRRYGVSVVAIRRDAQILSNPGADTLLQPNDELFVLDHRKRSPRRRVYCITHKKERWLMNPFIAVISAILHLRTCPVCKRDQVVPASKKIRTVPCKFCGADVPPRKGL
ncbi:MAG: hypothetical protein JRD47_07485 [Deltaproteobacteria bacterium]|nr:hypothetical protein [Deltaproteobacteria bacterium]